MTKRNHSIWAGAVALFLVGCGGSSSSDDTEKPLLPDPDSDKVTMPDGTIVDRPNVEDIHPDAIPAEMENEYLDYVEKTKHLRDPRDNVYELVSVNDQGAEIRNYLVINGPTQGIAARGWPYGTAYAFTDAGECYAWADAATPNGPLHGQVVVEREKDDGKFPHGGFGLPAESA